MTTFIDELLSDYAVMSEIPVRWSDMDALNHVNNTIYLRYFEAGRIVYFNKVGLIEHRTAHSIGPILHSVYCRFRIPVTFPDTVTIGLKALNLQSDRFDMEMALVSHQHEKICANGSCTIVCYDYKNATKAPFPDVMRENLIAMEGASILP